jgi:hypothetical protein
MQEKLIGDKMLELLWKHWGVNVQFHGHRIIKGDVSQLNSGGYLLLIFRSPHKKKKIQIENIYIWPKFG